MAIYVSASSLKDFIKCSKKVYYRIFEPSLAVQSEASTLGIIAHKILEQSWDDKERAVSLASKMCLQENLGDHAINSIETYVHTYFEKFSKLLKPSDLIEHRFKVKLDTDVFLVGVFDRVSAGNVYDWKTTTKTPTRIDNDIQFNIYNMAYKMLFNSPPTGLYLASLREGRLVRYVESKQHIDTLRNGIIPEFVETIRKKEFIKSGLFSNQCYYCPYKTDCLSKGEEDVVVHTNFIQG